MQSTLNITEKLSLNKTFVGSIFHYSYRALLYLMYISAQSWGIHEFIGQNMARFCTVIFIYELQQEPQCSCVTGNAAVQMQQLNQLCSCVARNADAPPLACSPQQNGIYRFRANYHCDLCSGYKIVQMTRRPYIGSCWYRVVACDNLT